MENEFDTDLVMPAIRSDPQTGVSPFCIRCEMRKLCEINTAASQLPDQDCRFQVTAQDNGLKIELVQPATSTSNLFLEGSWELTSSSGGTDTLKAFTIHSKPALHGLLVELIMAKHYGYTTIDTDRVQLLDGPLQTLSHLIENSFWDNLTRSLDISNTALSGHDSKIQTDDPRPRIYIPHRTPEQYEYYSQIATDHPELRLDVQWLSQCHLTPQGLRDLNSKPGVLALAMEDYADENGKLTLRALPYVVPGGRFNEMYGWDSYFTTLGLLANGRVDICESMIRNFCFCIQHYGKILNANRTYYLGRSQPPFLTTMALAVCEKMGGDNHKALKLISLAVFAAIKEYYTVWMAEPRYHGETGLSRYFGEGIGFPPEVEPDHFNEIIGMFAAKHNVSRSDLVRAYDEGKIQDVELDEYLVHDRACRESGHDTTYRFVGRAADLATVDLNSCLYKYEVDIAHIINTYFDGSVLIPSEWRATDSQNTELATNWTERATRRRESMNKYQWCAERSMYFDYDTKDRAQTSYESATTFWPLWAGVASPSQAHSLVLHAIPTFEVHGGLLASTEKSRGEISPSRPLRQWDYPCGWAPHQMLAWDGLRNYGYFNVAERLIHRWISMIVKTFSDFNGTVVEKYDVTSKDKSHVAEAEYGNQGSDFSSALQTGFGWTNASLVHGLSILQSQCDACSCAAA